MSAAIIGLWKPMTMGEVAEVKHYAPLFQTAVMEVWDEEHLDAVVSKHQATLIVLEQDTHAIPLKRLYHPQRGFYLIGPKNGSIPTYVRDRGKVVQVETPSQWPLQPAVVGAIVLHHRFVSLAPVQVPA